MGCYALRPNDVVEEWLRPAKEAKSAKKIQQAMLDGNTLNGGRIRVATIVWNLIKVRDLRFGNSSPVVVCLARG